MTQGDQPWTACGKRHPIALDVRCAKVECHGGDQHESACGRVWSDEAPALVRAASLDSDWVEDVTDFIGQFCYWTLQVPAGDHEAQRLIANVCTALRALKAHFRTRAELAP